MIKGGIVDVTEGVVAAEGAEVLADTGDVAEDRDGHLGWVAVRNVDVLNVSTDTSDQTRETSA